MSNWWYNNTDPDSFKILQLDNIYEISYYSNHDRNLIQNEIKEVTKIIFNEVESYYNKNNIDTIEFGCGGGWFSKEILNYTINLTCVEGCKNGVDDFKKNLDKDIIHHDLRYPFIADKKYELAICMEIAEHLEPPFAGTLIYTLTQSSDLIYFTFCEPRKKHIHHPNEQYLLYWENIFNFFNFRKWKQLNGNTHRGRGYLFISNTIKT